MNYNSGRLIDGISRIAQLVEQSIYGRVTGLNPVATYQN